jgi:hypothetical protein
VVEGGSDGTDRYEGLQLDALPINDVDWTHRGEYIRTRSERKGPREFNVEPEWATEAALDPNRLIGYCGDGRSIEVVGLSRSAPARAGLGTGRVLKVWLVPKEPRGVPPEGEWWGASACDGNDRDRRDYWEEDAGDE